MCATKQTNAKQGGRKNILAKIFPFPAPLFSLSSLVFLPLLSLLSFPSLSSPPLPSPSSPPLFSKKKMKRKEKRKKRREKERKKEKERRGEKEKKKKKQNVFCNLMLHIHIEVLNTYPTIVTHAGKNIIKTALVRQYVDIHSQGTKMPHICLVGFTSLTATTHTGGHPRWTS